jgi:hypothetical protein
MQTQQPIGGHVTFVFDKESGDPLATTRRNLNNGFRRRFNRAPHTSRAHLADTKDPVRSFRHYINVIAGTNAVAHLDRQLK